MDQGDSDVQYSLGYCYVDVKGVKQDKGEAAKWLKSASKQKNTDM